MDEIRPVHRLFALSWIDFFEGTDVRIETELDLSRKQQFLDLVINRTSTQPLPRRLPDGFEPLGIYNLLTFKSHWDTLDAWTILELLGHFVNHRKQFSPSLSDLLPFSNYRLFAVCARFPHNLAQAVPLQQVQAGVYDLPVLDLTVRIIVANQVPTEEQNALLHLFSAKEELLQYGREHYRPRSAETSTLLYDLFRVYEEGKEMDERLKAYAREVKARLLASMSPEERLQGLSTEEWLKVLPPEERLRGLPPEERLKGLSPEERLKGLSVEEVLRILPPEVQEALLRKLKDNGSPSSAS